MASRGAALAAAAALLALLGVGVSAFDPTQHVGARSTSLNERPMIGVLSQPGEPAPKDMSYIAASYIKWIEAAGARCVPIFYDMSEAEVRERFAALNGVLIPGGGASLSPGHMFYDTAALLYELAVEANDNGDYFPVHGTCLGMETLCIIISGNYTLLAEYEAEDAAAPLLYTEFAARSHMMQSLPKDVVKNLQNTPIAMENHGRGVSMQSVIADQRLSEFWDVVSLSLDKQGASYISTLEAKKYPMTATQWHPEKNAFEWNYELKSLDHSPEAITMTQAVANFFVAETRKNMHKAANLTQEDAMLIYNWEPHFTGMHDTSGHAEETDFEQAYFFERAGKERAAYEERIRGRGKAAQTGAPGAGARADGFAHGVGAARVFVRRAGPV